MSNNLFPTHMEECKSTPGSTTHYSFNIDNLTNFVLLSYRFEN